VVYCHAPARWLYQGQRYLGSGRSGAKLALRMLRPYLLRWDRKAARSATRYLTQSTAVRDRIREAYGIEAEVLPAPYAMSPEGPTSSVAGLEPGFMLCVSRLLPYKNVEAACAAFADLPSQMLVVVGAGPGAQRLRRMVPRNVRVLGSVSDEQLRWLYANSSGLVAAGYEDYGLTPLEAAAFGKPAAVLRWGGYLDTVLEGETGVFFDQPAPREIRNAVTLMGGNGFHPDVIRAHAELYSEASFIRRLQEIVELETKLAGA
jgi:glycosyltransferase involved in cell wall biosynthesis